MSRRNEHDSDNEDDPEEPYDSSGDEWNVEPLQKAKREESGRRKSGRISCKPKRSVVEESASDPEEEPDDIEEEEDEDDYFSEEETSPKKRKSGGPGRKATKTAKPKKKIKVTNESDLSNDTSSNMSQEDKKETATDSDSSRTDDYATGSFVILKKDAAGEDPSKHPVIWRIDGKALLQKYEAFDEDDKVLHKNTSIYTGWSPLDKDLYVPITVDVVRHCTSNLTVKVHWDQLTGITVDSD